MDTATAPTTETSVSPASLPDDFDIGKWAMEQDAGTAPAAPATETKADAPTTDAKDATATADKPAPETATQQKTSDTPKADGKPESAYTKAQKEAERRDKSWKALDEEKATFRQERAAITQQLETLKRELAQVRTATAGPAKDEHGATAETYERLARKYQDEGNDEMAEAAQARAAKLRRQTPAATPATAADPTTSPEFQQEWTRHTQELVAAQPELNDPNNPVVKATNALLQDQQWAGFFKARPNGIRAAVEVARLLEKSAQVDRANQELAKAQAEIKRLTSLTSPRGGPPNAPSSGKARIEEMSDADAAAEIRRIAEAADRGEV